jgi:cyclase
VLTADQVLPLTVGGGVRTLEDIRALLKAGADKVAVNTAAVADPGFVQRASERFGSQCIVVAIDAKRVRSPRSKVEGRRVAEGSPQSSDAGWEVFRGVPAYTMRPSAGEILPTSMDRTNEGGYDLIPKATAARRRIP